MEGRDLSSRQTQYVVKDLEIGKPINSNKWFRSCRWRCTRKREVLSQSRMSHGGTTKAPPDERGGNRYVLLNATAPHLDSTNRAVLTLNQPLPVYPDQRTSTDPPSWSGWCHKRKSATCQSRSERPCNGLAARETERDAIGNLTNEQSLNPETCCSNRVFCL